MTTAIAPQANRKNTETIELTGPRKAAILCLTLGREKAAEVMKQLNSSEVEELSREIATSSAVGPEVVQTVLVEFRGVFQAAEAAARGCAGYTLLQAGVWPQAPRTTTSAAPWPAPAR